ncbi:MAG: DEAD/DEAH box helicase family protein [Firmicutes bacterium]|nr:DEAD/DEAH box helicase family protein [Bacillota bacterium]
MQNCQLQNPFLMFVFLDLAMQAKLLANRDIPPPVENYRLNGQIIKEGAKTRFRNNITAIKTILELEASGATATKEQQDVLAKYAGWGGLSQVFDEQNENWHDEHNELKSLLSQEEYKSANESVLSAFYTSPTIIDGIYAGLKRLGFDGGTILEPAMGIGNFIGLLPSEWNVNMYGVEVDRITGTIAKYLYPQSKIKITGFENTNFPNGFFDCVVANVPFGSFKVYDKDYEKYNLFIHDYFTLKSLDKLRAGGIAAIITSKGTMDKASNYARSLFAERAKLIGAIRLPNTAFKDCANTEVTSDILFFQKPSVSRLTPTALSKTDWISVDTNADGILINKYFVRHPEMILGKMVKGKSMYGGDDETTCESDGRDLATVLSDAIENLPKNIYEKSADNTQKEPKLLADDYDIKNYCHAVIDGIIYQRTDELLLQVSLSPANMQKMMAMIELRETVRHILDIQIQNCSDDILVAAQQKLNILYDRFKGLYGAINHTSNRRLFRSDADYTLLLSLEIYDEVAGTAKKTDIFSKRTIRKYTRPDKADTALEALYISKNETGKVDLDIIEKLTDKSYDTIISELDGQIFRNPASCDFSDSHSGWETASEYLSGNVVQKLKLAMSISEIHPEFQRNVEALKKVQPNPLTASEICVRVGVPWIRPEIYRLFILEKFKVAKYDEDNVSVEFNKFTAEWKVKSPSFRNFQATESYGTKRVHGYRVFEYALNLQTPSVYDTFKDANGNDKRVLNKSETIAAREKLRILQEEFKQWIFDEPNRRAELVAIYNEKFNNLVLPQYNGSYLDFPEMNPNIELKSYQKDAVERIITSGNTLLHHVVGAGKTFEVAATAMKLRQLKLAQKPMIVVPNHLVLQWAHEFRLLYPNANLLIATKKDFEKENRLKFVSRIATGDWDAVVIAMSSFERLPISQERQERKIQEEIDNIEDALLEMKKDYSKRITVKNLQRVLKNKKTALEALSNGKKDSLIKFEELGVDYLFVDEAHKFKNKFIFTKMNNVAGISIAMSKRATDLDMKIDYITELHNGQKGIVFATGTPISNSMVEMYTMQSYLAKQDLRDAGLMFFDDWAAVFGDTVTALELSPSGQGYRTKTRFAKFVNLPEMLKMYRKFADVKTADMLNLPVPHAVRRVIAVKPTDEVLRLNDVITERAEKINAKLVSPEEDNMLKITSDGKKLALDPRCFDPSALDHNENKVNICAREVFMIWNETIDTRRTQLVFCDLSTPKCAFKDYDPRRDFDVYNHFKYVLVKMGVPENEIAFIHDANTDTAKQILFDNVRSGKVRILIGSTEKCGAGTNVQNKLVAIHHLDTPYRPSDMEQREGRGIRQGNENDEIEICTYVTERTFDAYSYQILENKQRFISQINKGEFTVREAQDIDETTFTYAEIKAITSANPLIKRKNEVEIELSSLRVLQGQYRQSRYSLQDNITNYLPKAIEKIKQVVGDYEKDILLRDRNMSAEFSMNIIGKTFTERKEAAELYHKLASNVNVGRTIATFNGFDIVPEFADSLVDRFVSVKGNGSYRIAISESPIGSLTRIENFFKNMKDNLDDMKNNLSERESELKSAISELDKPFEHEQRILDLSAELGEIEAKLDLDKAEIEVVIDDDDLQSEIPKDEVDTNNEGYMCSAV